MSGKTTFSSVFSSVFCHRLPVSHTYNANKKMEQQEIIYIIDGLNDRQGQCLYVSHQTGYIQGSAGIITVHCFYPMDSEVSTTWVHTIFQVHQKYWHIMCTKTDTLRKRRKLKIDADCQ